MRKISQCLNEYSASPVSLGICLANNFWPESSDSMIGRERDSLLTLWLAWSSRAAPKQFDGWGEVSFIRGRHVHWQG